jgi:hypothetical protein
MPVIRLSAEKWSTPHFFPLEKPMSEKKHYFLISGSIMFTVGDIKNLENIQPSSIFVNAIVRHDDKNFPAQKLAKAQQNLHKSFVMKLPEPELANIHDIIILSVSHLGEMTEEEFQATPEGLKLPTEEKALSINAALEA